MSIESKVYYQPDLDGRIPLVTGATGSIGGYLVDRLSQTTPVKAMVRNERDYDRLAKKPNVQPVMADVTDRDSVRRALENVSVVYHSAAYLSLTDWEMDIRVNVLGTENVIRAAEENGARHLHFISSVAYYGHQDKHPVTEDAHPYSNNAYGVTKKIGEGMVLDPANRFEASVVRPSNVIGAEMDAWTHAILNTLDGKDSQDFRDGIKKAHRIGLVPAPLRIVDFLGTSAVFSYVTADNLVDLSIMASQDPRGAGEVFNGVDEMQV